MSLLVPPAPATRARAVRAGCVGALLLLVSCGGGDGSTTPPKPVLTTLTVSLASSSVEMGSRTTATAAGLDQNDAPIAIGPVSWSTGSSTVATILSTGEIAAVGAGSTTVVATVGSVHGQSQLTVTPLPVDSVLLTSTSLIMIVGTNQTLLATPIATDRGGLPDRVVTWSSSDTAIAGIAPGVVNGFAAVTVTGVGVGSATITATSEGKQTTATITVKPVPVFKVLVAPSEANLTVGDTRQLTATTLTRSDSVLTDRVVTLDVERSHAGGGEQQRAGDRPGRGERHDLRHE